jgi:hypothetical protein
MTADAAIMVLARGRRRCARWPKRGTLVSGCSRRRRLDWASTRSSPTPRAGRPHSGLCSCPLPPPPPPPPPRRHAGPRRRRRRRRARPGRSRCPRTRWPRRRLLPTAPPTASAGTGTASARPRPSRTGHPSPGARPAASSATTPSARASARAPWARSSSRTTMSPGRRRVSSPPRPWLSAVCILTVATVRSEDPSPVRAGDRQPGRADGRAGGQAGDKGSVQGDPHVPRGRALHAALPPVHLRDARDDHPHPPLLHGLRVHQRRPDARLHHQPRPPPRTRRPQVCTPDRQRVAVPAPKQRRPSRSVLH